jgi:hypothetical protein
MKIFIFFIICILLVIIIVRYYFLVYIGRDQYIPTAYKMKKEESTCFIKLTSEKTTDTNKVIVFIHGGAFFSGMARGSISLVSKIASDTNLDAYLLKYPVNETDTNTILWMLYALEHIECNNIILVAASAGSFWAIYLMCCIYSSKFAQHLTISLKKNIIGFVSLCGLIDSDSKQRIWGNLFLSPKYFIQYIVGNSKNPYHYIGALDHTPFLLIDSSENWLNFAHQIIDLQTQRFQRNASQTGVFIYPKQYHNFMYNWKLKETRQVFGIIKDFIEHLTYNIKEPLSTNITIPTSQLNEKLVLELCKLYGYPQTLPLGNYMLNC